MYMERPIIVILLLCVILILGCIGQKNTVTGINMEKYSERTDGSREITIYQSPDKKIIGAVFKNSQPTDFGKDGLLKELLWVETNTLKMDGEPSVYQIDGHMAMSIKTIQVDENYGLPTNNRPDHYLTAISYPEKNLILTITCNGDGVTWDTENEMVNEFKL